MLMLNDNECNNSVDLDEGYYLPLTIGTTPA